MERLDWFIAESNTYALAVLYYYAHYCFPNFTLTKLLQESTCKTLQESTCSKREGSPP